MAAVWEDVEEEAAEREEVCAESACGNLFARVLARSGWSSDV